MPFGLLKKPLDGSSKKTRALRSFLEPFRSALGASKSTLFSQKQQTCAGATFSMRHLEKRSQKTSFSLHNINNSKKTLEAFNEIRENQQIRPNCLRKNNFSDELLFTLNLTPEQEPCACATISLQGLENRF